MHADHVLTLLHAGGITRAAKAQLVLEQINTCTNQHEVIINSLSAIGSHTHGGAD